MKNFLVFCSIFLIINSINLTVGSISEDSRYQDRNTFFMLSNIITVDDEGDGDFRTINDAINNSDPGTLIKVYSGIYNETIVINTEDIELEGVNFELGAGNDVDHPIINGNNNNSILYIISSGVKITGFLIQFSGDEYHDAGIRISSDNNIIMSNGILGNNYGIVIESCNNNEITYNYLIYNSMDGIYLNNASDNDILNNVITDNNFQGIFLKNAHNNMISENTVSLNGWDGIHLRNQCTENIVIGNTISSNNIDGIKLKEDGNDNNIFKQNVITTNRFNGIHIIKSGDNEIIDNNITGNLLNGIHLGNSDNNSIIMNTISDNYGEGIILYFNGCKNNLIYHNNILNDNAVDNGDNNWDNGQFYGGNYWLYYQGSDSDGDGFGDTPYIIPGAGNIDRYPFINPVLPPNKPDKPSGPVYGQCGRGYTYSTIADHPNGKKIQYGWDWDGDKGVDEWTDFYNSSETCKASHIWDTNGSYKVSVIAMDEYGLISDWSDPLPITMPKNWVKNLITALLQQLNFFY